MGPNILVESQQKIASILVASLLDSTRAFPTVSQLVMHELRERPLIERRKHWPPVHWRVHQLAVALQWRDHRIGRARCVPLLFLPVDVHTPVLQRKVLPADTTPARVVRVPEQFPDADSCVRENEHQSPVTSRLQRRVARSLLVERVSISRECRVRLDGIADPLVDTAGERVALFGGSGLVCQVVKYINWFFCHRLNFELRRLCHHERVVFR